MAAVGGCHNCTIAQCIITEDKDCLIAEGTTEEENKCVSSSCNNTDDCMKKLGRKAGKYECKDGHCEIDVNQIKIDFDKLSRTKKKFMLNFVNFSTP